ncbi:MAG: glutaredoxin family protein [Cyanobium sp. Prado107]|nr:glutaredoxin family protein [Cyanobium sp. Prado107]
MSGALSLRLLSRAGCCLCEGLEEKLRALDPAPELKVVDVDQHPALRSRYGLEVPVLLHCPDDGDPRELPRVPPRLQGQLLQSWLHRHCSG